MAISRRSFDDMVSELERLRRSGHSKQEIDMYKESGLIPTDIFSRHTKSIAQNPFEPILLQESTPESLVGAGLRMMELGEDEEENLRKSMEILYGKD